MQTPSAVSRRLRYIRQQQHLTLKQVEIRSRGKWKAVVVGSYERGVRALSIAKAEELCTFYGVPLEALFIDARTQESTAHFPALILDLRKIRNRLEEPDQFTHQLNELISWISTQRSDWNGEVMSLRKTDNDLLLILTRKNQGELADALKNRGFRFTKPNLI